MSSIPSGVGRVPGTLSASLLLTNLNRTNLGLLQVQEQLSTGLRVNRVSDDALRASTILTLQDRLERSDQRITNLTQASGTLGVLDSALGDASELILRARDIASSQVGIGSDADTRNAEAVVVDGLIQELYRLANRESNGLFVFGGSTATRSPVEGVLGGYRYVGQGDGLRADLGESADVPVTIGGQNAIGEVSARLRSTVDLDPGLSGSTRLVDLRGARGVGVSAGQVAFSFDGGPTANVDLSGADTVQDVVDAVEAAILQYEVDNGVTILDVGGVSVSGSGISVDVVAGAPDPVLTFSDVGGGVTGADLGLTQAGFEATVGVGADLDPRVTLETAVGALSGVTVPMDSIRFIFSRNGTATVRVVDLSGATTVGEIKNTIESQVEGVRVEIDRGGNGINLFNEIQGVDLSIEETAGGANTASELGIRSLDVGTALSAFNSGRGVRIVTGQVDPVTGVADPARDVDFEIELGSGATFTVDLRTGDLATVGTVMARIQAEADAQLGAGVVNVGLTDNQNGIAIEDLTASGAITVTRRNNSQAALDLGLVGGVFDAGANRLVAQDVAKVRVDGLFSALMDLRDALRSDDSAGITVAGEQIEAMVDRVSGARAGVGVHASRVDRAVALEEEQVLQDTRIRSELQDLDFSEAAIRLNMLQTQLQASLQSGAVVGSLSLLDFLG